MLETTDRFETPMMRQYLKIKNAYADCLLLFRLGDFYEMFLEDAKLGAEVLDITLTSRDRGSDGRIPMAGIPYHALDSYLHKLIKAGHKVAICEQVSAPGPGVKIVEREVVRVVTPGTTLDAKSLRQKENNYIISISRDENLIGIAVADISTGEFYAFQHELGEISQFIKEAVQKFNPSECILPAFLYEDPAFLKMLSFYRNLNVYRYDAWSSYAQNEKYAEKFLKRHFRISSLRPFSIHDKPHAVISSAALLGYLKDTQKTDLPHIRKIKNYDGEESVVLDPATIFNLELFSTIREKNRAGTLINVIDKTCTSMGGRLLKHWVKNPLRKKAKIEDRLEVVNYFYKERFLREDLRQQLSQLLDIERLVSRLSVGIGNARDLVNLRDSLVKILEVKKVVSKIDLPLLKILTGGLPEELNKVIKFIGKNIVENPPIETKEGKMIKRGVNKELDLLNSTISKSKKWISAFEETERERTGISSLKVKFNKVFGFYIEISKANLDYAPEDYFRKQTMVNAERFITEELKEQEQIVLSAEEKINKLEYRIFVEIVNTVMEQVGIIQTVSGAVAALDCLLNFAFVAQSNDYSKPQIVENGVIKIKNGRHPVVEQYLEESLFVPNDIELDGKKNQLLILTGPNMAGKSVFIRQVALITLLAHIGSFVPAENANICIVDRIFVRSGASDVITQGLSTFMIEMIEAGYILNHATKDSLIVMDELGRGTSTYDGISIAGAIAEYIATKVRAKTLFATHYHELQDLENEYRQIKNYQVAVKHENGELVFLHKVVPGGASHSFGINVAELAGIPAEITKKAKKLLRALEGKDKWEK